jgi:hypothetical protein
MAGLPKDKDFGMPGFFIPIIKAKGGTAYEHDNDCRSGIES